MFLVQRTWSFPVLCRLRYQSLHSSAVRTISLFTRAQSCAGMSKLEELVFDNRALKNLPVETDTQNYVRTVVGACFSRVRPTPLTNPQLVAHSQSALDLLGLSPDQVKRKEFVEYLSGNTILPGSEPASHCYCGHQFGNFAGQLGDGCAHYLGEVVGPEGQRWELQLKGSGKTPYSRFADGRKVLRSSIREFLCSEAMHCLGIPTTRAGSCITSDDTVTRDIFYDGNSIQEKCTVITRVSPTFIRFGSFEIVKTRDSVTGRTGPSVGRQDILYQLLDFVIQSYYSEAHRLYPEDRPARVAHFFKDLCMRTAHLVSAWQCVGFCHGVLNTDNMSIVGVTIDYGPYGFMDRYDPGHICNSSDNRGRYAYGQQPRMCRWNLSKLAEVLSSCLSEESVEEGLTLFDSEFKKSYVEKMRLKLGLRKEDDDDGNLIGALLDTMDATGCDFTNAFQCLSHVKIPHHQESITERDLEKVVEFFLNECSSPQQLVQSYTPSMPPQQFQMFVQLMQQSPEILQALGMSPQALKLEMDKMEKIDKLKNMSVEEKRSADRSLWLKWLITYSRRLYEEVDTQQDVIKVNQERLSTMKEHNPRFILRNHILQSAIQQAENGDFSEVQRLYKLLQTPYEMSSTPEKGSNEKTVDIAKNLESKKPEGIEEGEGHGCDRDDDHEDQDIVRYYSKPPDWALTLCVT